MGVCMDPCVIIPTFWTRRRGRVEDRLLNVYDHPTPVSEDGTLPECLASVERTCGDCKVVVVVAADDPSLEDQAEERVSDLLAAFPALDGMVFGAAEMSSLHRRLEQLEFADMVEGVSLLGYGAVRNVGLVVAAALGREAVVFVDDDQVVDEEDFVERALFGLGEEIDGMPVLAKSGYYVDRAGEYRIRCERHWSDVLWRQTDAYNAALSVVRAPRRLRPTALAFGGCMALHRDMYVNVSFDPWITRGEDLDYVINARMHGADVFLDNEWSIVHDPPPVSSEALGFRQDVYRFIYEHRKLEFAKSQVDLRQVSAKSLAPYPGDFIGSAISWRASVTGLLRALSGRDPRTYLKVVRSIVRDIPAYAERHCRDYFAFQRRWPIMMERLWDDVALKPLLLGERRVDRSAITGRFPSVGRG